MAQSNSTFFTYPTPHGPMTISANERGIARIAFEETAFPGERRASELTNRAATEIHEYLAGKRTSFDIPLDPEGSAFQKEVWACVGMLGYGEVCTAADIARNIGKAGAHRSVGTAIRRNPIPILIPTHRVDLPNATGKVARIYRALRTLEANPDRRPQ